MPSSTRAPAVAGSFYPADSGRLNDQLVQLLAEVDDPGGPPPKMLLVPHAGYVYSGPVAAHAYARLTGSRIERVVLLGPAHRVPLRGLAAPTAEEFETPLGRVVIDRAAMAQLQDLPQVVANDGAHALEHSLEVQLPFLQNVLGDFMLVPLAVGDASGDEVAEVLDRLWGGDETLIVISSDLSHYLPCAQARRLDGATIARVLALEAGIGTDEACGAFALNGALQVAHRRRLRARLLDLRNSGDTAGDSSRVVGYAAVAFDEPAP
ncbi:AmmeMemoRadiSam system protein B [Piscinibacter sp. XHJ-5]|uniref:AmmeMemoRadiSam system protein B n=1 Tax=Piscinibacter sp. XHJ-5 TaxID=3037797 RepID=UPI00245345DD|nr:AmmeMemoRadiSam system protein B [Piscinibacter sp. XHJ-5]